MLHYIIQTIVFQLFFLIIYDLFLKQETFFNWNRFYLLASIVLSITLPFIKIEFFKTVIPIEYTIGLPEIVLSGGANEVANDVNRPMLEALNTNPESFFTWSIVFYLGCIIAVLLFIYKLFRILFLAYKNPKTKFKDAFLVQLLNSELAFSFFNYIFIGEQIQGEEKKAIIAHEEVHVKQKHSLDLLFFEVLRILFWFNPLIYIYQRKIANIHEFTADSEAVKVNKTAYYENLLAQVFQTKKISFVNPFFKKSLIKKRIIMLNKTKSKQLNLIKYALLIPMVLGMLVYTSCSEEVMNDTTEISNKKLEQYTFSVDKTESISPEKQVIKDSAELFLRANSETHAYIIEYDKEKEITTYSVEKVVEDLSKLYDGKFVITFKDKTAFTAYTQTGVRLLDSKDVESMNVLKSSKAGMDREAMSFNVLDRVPTYPGCDESMSNEAIKKCFTEKITQLVMKNFNTKKLETNGEVGKHKIYVLFNINKGGAVNNLKVRAKYKEFETEARRVMSLLPTFTPGEYNGEVVSTNYYLPIKFEIK